MSTAGIIVMALATAFGGLMQDQQDDATLMRVTREIMVSARYCALITLDDSGTPAARAMDPFPPEEDLVVWLGTNARTRKVADLTRDPRAALYCHAAAAGAYVTLRGTAAVVTDQAAKARHWKAEWKDFYDDEFRGDDYVLLRFEPEIVEIISMKHGVATDPRGFAPAILRLR